MNALITKLAPLAITLTLAATAGCGASQTPLSMQVYTAGEAGFHVTSTLIEGEREAVLIDAQFTLSEGANVAEWVAATGKELTAIYITHAHPDHYFGVEKVLERFPNARLLATPETIEAMEETAADKVAQWKPIYGDDLTDTPLVPEALTSGVIELEGAELEIEAVAQADTHPATIVRVSELDAVIVGDLAYSHVHVWLAEVDADGRQRWVDSLAEVAASSPAVVVAGHKLPALADSPEVLDETQAYIEGFGSMAAAHSDAAGLAEAVKGAFEGYALPIIADISAQAALPAAE
ncbi:MAG: MBL fold metallo-hydrolase [Haliangiales bacterium]